MKFGKRIRFMTVFVWADHYVDYKALKVHVRKIKEGKEQEEAFIEKFKAELKRVNTFFASEVNGTIQRLASLLQRTQDYINSGVYNMFGIDSLHRALSTLNRRLTDLQDFCEVNLEGFRKSVKKVNYKDVSRLVDVIPLLPLARVLQFQKHVHSRDQRHTQTFLMTVVLPHVAPNLCRPDKLYSALSSIKSAFQQLDNTRRGLAKEIESMHPHVMTKLSGDTGDEEEDMPNFLARFGSLTSHSGDSLSSRLRAAVRLADADRVAYILRTSLSDANITSVIAIGGPLLHLTTASGDIASSKLLLKLGVDINVRDVVDRTSLQNALRAGQRDMAEFLLQNGADLNSVAWNRHTLLHSAVAKGNPDCVRLLLEYRAKAAPPITLTGNLEEDTRNLLNSGGMLTALLARDGGGFNSLYFAASRNHPKCLTIILQAAVYAFRYSSQPNAVQLSVPRDATTGSLSVESKEIRLDKVQGLLSRQIGLNVQWTALHGAAQNGAHRCVRILLETINALPLSSEKDALHALPPQRRATINYPDEVTNESSGELDLVNCRVGATCSTPLHEVAQRGYIRTAAWLLKAGACTTVGNAYGETPLHLAARAGHASTLTLMLRFTPLWALSASLPESVPIPVDVTRKQTPFLPIPEETIGRNAEDHSTARSDFQATSSQGCHVSKFYLHPSSWIPLLHEAIDSSSTVGARTSSQKRDIREKDETASSSGSAALRCVKALLKAGANALEDDNDGWSALALALYIGNGQVAQLCRDYSISSESSCSLKGCSPPEDWSKRGKYVSKEEAINLGAGQASADSGYDSPEDDIKDTVEEGHATLGDGEWELRVTLGGIPSVKGTVSVPAVSLLPWALPEETASLVNAHHQDSSTDKEAETRSSSKKNGPIRSLSHRLARLEEQEYATTKRVRLNVRKVTSAGPPFTNRFQANAHGNKSQDFTGDGFLVADNDEIEEHRINLPLYYRKHPGPSAQPLNVNAARDVGNDRANPAVSQDSKLSKAEQDITMLTRDRSSLSHQQSLQPKSENDSSNNQESSDSDDSDDTPSDFPTLEQEEEDKPGSVQLESTDRTDSMQKSVYAESVGSSCASVGTALDNEVDDLQGNENNCLMCVGDDGQMVNTHGMEVVPHSQQVVSEPKSKVDVETNRNISSSSRNYAETIGIWETARPGELSSLATDPEADAEIVFHGKSPFDFNLSVDVSAAGTGIDSISGKSLAPASLLTRCNPTSYTFQFNDQSSHPRVMPEYGSTAGHEQDGYGIHRWSEEMPIRMSGQIALPILSSKSTKRHHDPIFPLSSSSPTYSSAHHMEGADSTWVSKLVAAVSRGSGDSSLLEHLGILTIRYMLIRPYKPPIPVSVAPPKHSDSHIGEKKKANHWKSSRNVTAENDKVKVFQNSQLDMVPFVGGPTKVFGHRGSGADAASRLIGEEIGARVRRTHVAENTLLSFVTAANLGAEYIEFDVQLSNDLVPIIHHDWEITLPLPGGIKMPVTHLTAEQLQQLRPGGGSGSKKKEQEKPPRDPSRPPPAPSSVDSVPDGESPKSPALAGISGINEHPPPFSVSDGSQGQDLNKQVTNKSLQRPANISRKGQSSDDSSLRPGMAPKRALEALGLDHSKTTKHRELASKYEYGLQDSFTTLAKVFQAVPTRTGFNIEVKYPNPQQAVEHGIRPVDKNTYVEKILDCVFTSSSKDRKIMFSSFDPDICLLLSKKQGIYPVFLLTAAGTYLYADPRKNSLRAAVRFAVSNGLLGIVSESEPLVEAPRLITEVRNAGLVLCTYGQRNNEVNCVKVQVANGVAAVIVDHVAHVTRSLREESERELHAEKHKNKYGSTITGSKHHGKGAHSAPPDSSSSF